MSQFSKEDLGKMLKIRCPSLLDANAAKDFADHCKSWMLSSAEHFVIDLEGVTVITREFYQSVIHLKTNLKRDQKMIHSINMADALFKQIKADGVEMAFNVVKSMDDILGNKNGTASTNSSALNVAFINPFLTGAQKTLEVQCKTVAKAQKPFLKKEKIPGTDIAGVLSMTSDNFSANIAICFPAAVFLKIYEGMFGEKHEQITTELEDAAAELMNIIYGMAKIELNSKGYNFPRAFPSVMTGAEINIRQSGVMPAVVIPFESDAGSFHIEIECNNKGGNNV